MTRLAVAAVLLLPAAAPAAPIAAKPRSIDLVLCLDVSNSMDGLIDSAKLRLWDIVNELSRVRPTPRLRVGLYSYGHNHYSPSTGWVRKELDLCTDLDEVYAKLTALKTLGGTEYVTRVTTTALDEQDWADEPRALRVMFVCGNEPADQDKRVTLDDAIEAARGKGVIVNTIFCGPTHSSQAVGWRRLAAGAGGKYAAIDQDRARSEPVIDTPYDKPLVDCNEKLNRTYVPYGKGGKVAAENQVLQDRNAEAAAPQAAASRAVTKANDLYRNDKWDLVDKLKDDPKFDVAKLPAEELPEAMQKLSPAARGDYIRAKAMERAAVQKEINDLSAKRAAFVAGERAKQPKAAGDQALDEALKGIIREQAAANGFETK